jgi:hypothetical protein
MLSSILINFMRSLGNSQKKFKLEEMPLLPKLEYSDRIRFSSSKLQEYKKLVQWSKSEIPPLFPYALLTHLQFSIVNDKNFPFSPFGLIHKTENIHCLKPLVSGLWEARMMIDNYKVIETGVEIDFKTELKINGEVHWTSVTKAFKKLKQGSKKNREESQSQSQKVLWQLPSGLGRKYGLVSLNIDPIHMFNSTAKLMGHKSAIIHGMWTVARGLSEMGSISYPMNLKAKFLSPIYLPSNVFFVPSQNGFSIHAENDKLVHLVVEVLNS